MVKYFIIVSFMLSANAAGINDMANIAIANLKGGIGKSTIAVNLSCALAHRRSTVTVVDADITLRARKVRGMVRDG